MRRETRLALCRCGQSKHMPLCDNTHRAIGFRSTD
jgi:CDGSH-type Zn-finger protein